MCLISLDISRQFVFRSIAFGQVYELLKQFGLQGVQNNPLDVLQAHLALVGETLDALRDSRILWSVEGPVT